MPWATPGMPVCPALPSRPTVHSTPTSFLHHPSLAELPYEINIIPVSCRTMRDGSLRVEHIIAVPSESIKRIVVGSQGSAIKHVGTGARLELQRMWQQKVHLILTVKAIK